MNEVSVVREEASPLALMQMAVEKGFSTDQLKVLFELNNRHNEQVARQAFAVAKCNVQQKATVVIKATLNQGTNKKYASLEHIDQMIRPLYTDEGLSLDFSEDDCDKDLHMRVRMVVTHRLGHSEERHMDIPLVDSGQAAKNKTWGKGSTFSYGKRYLTVAYFNIPIVGEDDDGQGRKFNPQTPTEVQSGLKAQQMPLLRKAAEQGPEQLRDAVELLSSASLEAVKSELRGLALPILKAAASRGEIGLKHAWECMRPNKSKTAWLQLACQDEILSLKEEAKRAAR